MDQEGWPSRPWSFAALPPCAPEQAAAVVVSAPLEATVSYRPGTRLGPQAIIEASRNMEHLEEETGSEPHLAGIATLEEPELPTDCEAALALLEPICAKVVAAGSLPVILGGEHTVSLAAIRALAAAGGEFSILQLDAHADLRDSYLGNRLSHACTMRRALEVAPVVPVGIRSYSAAEREFMRREAVEPFMAREIMARGAVAEELAERVTRRLLPRVYVTIDLDVFDPAIMPAVGTPEPGGLDWYGTLALLRQVAARRKVVGFDVVELCPLPGNPAPDFLAARLVYKMLAYCLHSKVTAD